jgi:hypothetical protein
LENTEKMLVMFLLRGNTAQCLTDGADLEIKSAGAFSDDHSGVAVSADGQRLNGPCLSFEQFFLIFLLV